jgi:exo-beta-1,3-glucanase (GH17 family)
MAHIHHSTPRSFSLAVLLLLVVALALAMPACAAPQHPAAPLPPDAPRRVVSVAEALSSKTKNAPPPAKSAPPRRTTTTDSPPASWPRVSADGMAELAPQFITATPPARNETTPNSWPGACSSREKREYHFYGLSYSPFGLGDNLLCPPFDREVGGACLLPSQVKIDMDALATLTSRIKTYSAVCVPALAQIFASAEEHGMQILLGIWINKNNTENAAELNRIMPFIAKYHHLISHIIVGNEPLFIIQVPVPALVEAIHEVRRRVNKALGGKKTIPLGVADIYNTWMNKPVSNGHSVLDNSADLNPVVDVIDFIGLNYHPYWGGFDPHSGKAAPHVLSSALDIVERFNNKTVIITETGFPSAGESHTTIDGTATPDIGALSLFLTDMEAVSRKENLAVYMFEPYDGDWKRRWEPYAVADYNFGLATCDRKMKNVKLPPLGAI